MRETFAGWCANCTHGSTACRRFVHARDGGGWTMSFDGYVPDWLYGRLPVIYVAFGVLAIAALGSSYAILSGVILIGTGAAVWWMRHAYRARPGAARRTRRVTRPPAPASTRRRAPR
jgi:hypothetical protein